MDRPEPHRRQTLRLTKHHGLGNDFLVTVLEEGELAVAARQPAQARRWCDRRRGVGADGFIVVTPPGPADTERYGSGVDAVMALYNADGSRAEMSGNGIRCLAQALAMDRRTTSADFSVVTDAGLRTLQVRPDPDDATTVRVRVGMGPVLEGPAWAPSAAARAELARSVVAGHAVTADIGNPHLIVEVADPWQVDLARVGPLLEADFPAGCNVQFIAASPAKLDHLDLTVWERGAGITEACGTGASAAATVAHRWGLVGPRVTVHMPGGMVEVVVGDEQTELIGPATFIAHIEVDLG